MGKRRQGPFLSFGVLWPDLRVHRNGQAKVWGAEWGQSGGPRGHHHRLTILSHTFSPNPTRFPHTPPTPTAISGSTPLFITLTFCFTSPPHLRLLSSMVPLPLMAAKKSLRPFCTEGFEDLAPPYFFYFFFFFFSFFFLFLFFLFFFLSTASFCFLLSSPRDVQALMSFGPQKVPPIPPIRQKIHFINGAAK